MSLLRGRLCALLLAFPLWLAAPALASAQLLAADVDGDGVRDRVELGSRPAELVIRLTGGHDAQRLHAPARIIQVVAADIDHDGDTDLIATTRGARHLGLVVWTNRHGTFVPRRQHTRHASRSLARVTAGRVRPSIPSTLADDPFGEARGALAASSAAVRGPATASELLPHVLLPTTSRVRSGRRSPRGPPAPSLSA